MFNIIIFEYSKYAEILTLIFSFIISLFQLPFLEKSNCTSKCTAKWYILDLTYCGDHPSAVNYRWFREFDEHSRGAARLSMTDVEHERDDSCLRQHVKLHPDAIIQRDSAFSFCLLASSLNFNDQFH